jgi:hypothetical protein
MEIVCRPKDQEGVLVLRYWTLKISVFYVSGFSNYYERKERITYYSLRSEISVGDFVLF